MQGPSSPAASTLARGSARKAQHVSLEEAICKINNRMQVSHRGEKFKMFNTTCNHRFIEGKYNRELRILATVQTSKF